MLLPLAAAGLVCAALLRGTLAAPESVAALVAIPVVALGLLALSLLNFLTAMLAFVFQEITPFHLIKGELVAFFSGMLVPLAMMPVWARSVLRWTPFPALASLPASLWFGSATALDILVSLAVLALWNAVLFGACRLTLRRLLTRYEEVGS